MRRVQTASSEQAGTVGGSVFGRFFAAARLPLAGACLVAGLLAVSFPVWSGWWASHVQSLAAADFRAQLHGGFATSGAGSGKTSVAESSSSRGGTAMPLPGLIPILPAPAPSAPQASPQVGGVLAELQIPAIGVDQFVLRGLTYAPEVWARLLRDGPGHLAGSALPGQSGNVVIFGHLNIWGSIFYHLDLVKPGDTVVLTDSSGTFTYTVTGHASIAATDLAAVAPQHSGPAVLQLVTCETAFENDRLVVEAKLTHTAPASQA